MVMWNKKKKLFTSSKAIVLLFGIIAFLFPIVYYVFNFRKLSISTNPTDWALFGDYMGGIYGGIYSVIVTILVVYLARELSKKDNKRDKQIKVAETLYLQIKTIENNNHNYKSIDKLRKEINLNDLYLSDSIKNKLIMLADQFNEYKDNNGAIDQTLKNNVMEYLKNIYEQ